MSLVIRKRSVHEERLLTLDEVVSTLAREFVAPAPGQQQPLISVERRGSRTHLLVVWDEWLHLSQSERSELIMEAYEAAKGQEAALSVSAATGLTTVEAKRLGFDFEPAPQ